MIKKICLSMCLLSFLGNHQVSGAKVKSDEIRVGALNHSEGPSENLISRSTRLNKQDLSRDVESSGCVRRCGSSSKKFKFLVATSLVFVGTLIAGILGAGFFKGWFSSGGNSENSGVDTGGDKEQLFQAFQSSGLSRKALIHGDTEGPCAYQSGTCSAVTLFEHGTLRIGEVRRFWTSPHQKCAMKKFDCPLPVRALKEGLCMEMPCGEKVDIFLSSSQRHSLSLYEMLFFTQSQISGVTRPSQISQIPGVTNRPQISQPCPLGMKVILGEDGLLPPCSPVGHSYLNQGDTMLCGQDLKLYRCRRKETTEVTLGVKTSSQIPQTFTRKSPPMLPGKTVVDNLQQVASYKTTYECSQAAGNQNGAWAPGFFYDNIQKGYIDLVGRDGQMRRCKISTIYAEVLIVIDLNGQKACTWDQKTGRDKFQCWSGWHIINGKNHPIEIKIRSVLPENCNAIATVCPTGIPQNCFEKKCKEETNSNILDLRYMKGGSVYQRSHFEVSQILFSYKEGNLANFWQTLPVTFGPTDLSDAQIKAHQEAQKIMEKINYYNKIPSNQLRITDVEVYNRPNHRISDWYRENQDPETKLFISGHIAFADNMPTDSCRGYGSLALHERMHQFTNAESLRVFLVPSPSDGTLVYVGTYGVKEAEKYGVLILTMQDASHLGNWALQVLGTSSSSYHQMKPYLGGLLRAVLKDLGFLVKNAPDDHFRFTEIC